MARYARRPEGSNWGDFGPDDQLGRLNMIGPDQVLKGIAEVKVGRTFCLSLPLDLPGGSALNASRLPPRIAPTVRDGKPRVNLSLLRDGQPSGDYMNDDQVAMTLQYSTQWDALCHVGAAFDADDDGIAEIVFYNGYRAGEDIVWQGEESGLGVAKRLGVEQMARHGLQGRAVFVDLLRAYGPERTWIGYDKLMAAMHDQGASLEPGDMLVFRTGYAERLVEMAGKPDVEALSRSGAELDGTDAALLEWISESGVSAIAADNYGVENYPAPLSGDSLTLTPLHQHCLVKLGIPLAELWYLKDLGEWLAANKRAHFLLTAPPLNLPGAAGSPVTPIATV